MSSEKFFKRRACSWRSQKAFSWLFCVCSFSTFTQSQSKNEKYSTIKIICTNGCWIMSNIKINVFLKLFLYSIGFFGAALFKTIWKKVDFSLWVWLPQIVLFPNFGALCVHSWIEGHEGYNSTTENKWRSNWSRHFLD